MNGWEYDYGASLDGAIIGGLLAGCLIVVLDPFEETGGTDASYDWRWGFFGCGAALGVVASPVLSAIDFVWMTNGIRAMALLVIAAALFRVRKGRLRRRPRESASGNPERITEASNIPKPKSSP